tara:strand:+ start:384 stop:500 length:117 start_codon:yes stop_codon:yes gene_type:complete
MEVIAKKIVKAINKTNNDYDAVERVAEVLRKHFNEKSK